MLALNNVTIATPQRVLFRQLNLAVAPGEVATLMGPSGSGKSALLNWMAGATPAGLTASGQLTLNGRRLDPLPTEVRRLGIMFQDALLFPHFSTGHNLLLAAGRGPAAREQVEQALAAAGLAGFYQRDPATLSGGQQARVSLLRALLAKPQALLLDEPFARLDAGLKAEFRHWVYQHIAEAQIPALLVTHDIKDTPPGGRSYDLANWA